jgi:hypothetical protein
MPGAVATTWCGPGSVGRSLSSSTDSIAAPSTVACTSPVAPGGRSMCRRSFAMRGTLASSSGCTCFFASTHGSGAFAGSGSFKIRFKISVPATSLPSWIWHLAR